jgi:hypothetical protein
VFLSLIRGIYKTDSVVSMDFSVMDNTFEVCSTAAIELGDGPDPKTISLLRRSVPTRHLIEGNAIAVQGKGVVSATVLTEVVNNDIKSRLDGVELDAAACAVRDNLILGTAEGAGPDENALVVLHGGCWQVRVCGNRLMNASSHAILILDDLLDLTVEDNEIELARGFAVGTLSNNVVIQGARIAQNRIRGCGAVTFTSSFRGVLRFGQCVNFSIVDNVIVENRPIGAGPGQTLLWSVLYFANAAALDLTGNRIIDNLPGPDVAGYFVTLYVEDPRSDIKIQNNVIRGNAGSVIEMQPLFLAFTPVEERPRMLIQSNHLSAGARRAFWFARIYYFERLLFQGNNCEEETRNAFTYLPMYLYGDRMNVFGNSITFAGLTSLYVNGDSVLVDANTVDSGARALEVRGAGRTIVTSNITSGQTVSATGTLIRIHNIPAP